MSCLALLLNDCPNLQFKITDYFQTCNHEFLFEAMPFMEFLTSPANTNGLTQQISPGGGKTRIVDLRYERLLAESVVATNQPNPNCTATSKRGDCTKRYEIDSTENLQAEQLIEAADLEKNCEANSTYFARQIMRLIDVLDRRVATKTATEAALLTGNWSGDVSPVVADALQVKTLKDGETQVIDPFTYENIVTAAKQTGYCAPLFVAGTIDLHKYFLRTAMKGCCTDQGIDLNAMWEQFGIAFAYDRRIVDAFGSDMAILTQPRSLVLLHYVRAPFKDGAPMPIQQGANYFYTTVISPRLGIPYDLAVKDDCGNISITVTATTKLENLPDDLFPGEGNYAGVNFFNKIQVANV